MQHERDRPRIPLAAKIGLVASAILGLLIAACGYWMAYSQKIIARNMSGAEITDVTLGIGYHAGGPRDYFGRRRLAAGASFGFRHDHRDANAKLSFTLNGKRIDFEEPYIDFWTGESWVLDIQPDGSVVGGYGPMEFFYMKTGGLPPSPSPSPTPSR